MNSYFSSFLVTPMLLLSLASCSQRESAPQQWDSPAGPNSVSPNLSVDLEGSPILSWMKVEDDFVSLNYSKWDSTQWSIPITVARGENWLVNRADFPSVVQLSDSVWVSHWLVMTDPSIFAYDVKISLSIDGGKTWGAGFTPHTDGTHTEHGFVSFFADDEDVGVVWLDGREMVGGHGQNSTKHEVSAGINGMTLRSTKITKTGSIYQDQIIDDLVCDCCQTDISATPAGPVAVFRNRTEDERRDIYFSRMIDGVWSKSKAVAKDDWIIAGCPVNGPSVAANKDNTAVAWYTQAKGFGEVKLAISDNGADEFSSGIEIDSGKDVLGQVGLAAVPGGGFVISWMVFTGGSSGQLRLRYVSNEGIAHPPVLGAVINLTSRAGLPQMVISENNAVLSWTGGDGKDKSVQVAYKNLDSLLPRTATY